MRTIKIFLLVFGFSLVFFWRWHSVTARDYVFQNDIGQEVSFEAKIVDDPLEDQKSIRLVLAPDGTRERVLVTVDPHVGYRYGDRIMVEGKIELPENFETDTGREFDYVHYLAKERVYYRMFKPKIVLHSESVWSIRGQLFALKRWFLGGVARVIPEPSASLAGGLVVGARGMDDDIEEAFRKTGLSHIVVLSGQNLSIIADAAMRNLSLLSFKSNVAAGGIFVVLFALLAGGGASVARATIMVVISLFARLTGQMYDAAR
ncbi:MAG TPA: ComEC family competence protein, partial [Candidatus Paceibacterota bacterium]|nr:ComEC family competence protein [Candidatus Paceibacterota bacterium]